MVFGVPMSNQQKSPLIRYRYDALDRLSSHRQLDNSDCQRFYCVSHLVTEVQGDEHISIVQHGDQLLAQHQRQDAQDKSGLIATDLQRSVLHALQASGLCAIAYSPYGHRNVESGLSYLLGFNGQRPDPLTGHYLLGNGYRAFAPLLMRFNSPDNLSPFGKGGLNAYAYCQGEPVNRSDAQGHFFSTVTSAFSKMKFWFLSSATGDRSKQVTRFTRVSEEVAVFVDKYKGGSRLNIYGHGTGTGGVQWEKGVFLGPKKLSENIRASGFAFESFDSVRLLTCHSGNEFQHVLNPSGASYGQLFSDFSGLPVKAYNGRVLMKNLRPQINQLKVGETSVRFQRFHIAKNNESRRSKLFDVFYDPVTFRPSELVQDVRRK